MSTAFQKAVRKYGKGRKTPEARPEYKEDTIRSRNYDLVTQLDRFPNSSEEEVQLWAEDWFNWKARQKRVELRSGNHLRKIWKEGKHFRELIEKALGGETLYSEQDLQGAGAIFLTLLSHHHWEELEAIATATKATVDSTKFTPETQTKLRIVTLNCFDLLSTSGKLPTKEELKTEVRKRIKSVGNDNPNFSKVFNDTGLRGLPEGKRGPKAGKKRKK